MCDGYLENPQRLPGLEVSDQGGIRRIGSSGRGFQSTEEAQMGEDRWRCLFKIT
jgi:hypothetical protein